jgi:PIN domain nuclease of toxin-antitoxin system
VTRYLTDTSTFIWWQRGSNRLSKAARHVLSDSESVILGSIVIPLELAIKTKIGSLPDGDALLAAFYHHVETGGLTLLAPGMKDIAALRGLPLIHRDPFDRMLIAQGLVTGAPILTSDANFSEYGVPVVW